MSTLKERIFTNWHLVRIVRLGIGIMLLVMGIQSRDWVLGMFSTFFLYQAITDTGCCGTQGCAPQNPARRDTGSAGTGQKGEIIEFEEIK